MGLPVSDVDKSRDETLSKITPDKGLLPDQEEYACAVLTLFGTKPLKSSSSLALFHFH